MKGVEGVPMQHSSMSRSSGKIGSFYSKTKHEFYGQPVTGMGTVYVILYFLQADCVADLQRSANANHMHYLQYPNILWKRSSATTRQPLMLAIFCDY